MYRFFCCSLLLLSALALPLAAQIAPDPLIWLRADSGVVVTDGRVSHWNDIRRDAFAARQDTAEKRPMLIANAAGGLPAVRFNGTTNYLECTPLFPVSSDYTLLFVVRLNNIFATNNVVSGDRHAHWFGSTGYAKVLHGNFNAQAVSSIPIAQGELAIVSMSFLQPRQRASIHINGLFSDSATVGTNLDPTFYLGAFQRANLLNGDIAEVILYDHELSDPERKLTEAYLFGRYGIPVPPPPPPRDTTFSSIPAQLQFFARDANDSATVPISGSLRAGGFDSIYVEIARNNQPWKRIAEPLVYTSDVASFDLQPKIFAELSEYRFTVGVKSATRDSIIARRDSIVCGDAYLINGQSNSIFGNGSPVTHEFARTFGLNFSSIARDTLWALARSSGNGGGPDVGAWGLRLQRLLIESTGVPICIINGGVGGTTIEQHQRNDTDPASRSTIYGSLLYRARKAGLADKVRGMLWYQGEANMIFNYYDNFKALYTDWREDYPSLEKFYVVQIRPGCAAGDHRELRELQRTLSDSLPDIVTYSPMGVTGHDGCHFIPAGYDTIGAQIFRLVARDFYGSVDTVDIGSPEIIKAFYTDASYRRIALVFDNARGGLRFTPDTIVGGIVAGINRAFALDDAGYGLFFESGRISADTLYLTVNAPWRASTIHYIPSAFYWDTQVIFEGPWVKNGRGLGAFGFFNFPIDAPEPVGVVEPRGESGEIELAAVPNPAERVSDLTITLPRSGPVVVRLYDGSGACVLQREIDALAGRNVMRLDVGELPAGLYHCEMRCDQEVRSIRLVVVR